MTGKEFKEIIQQKIQDTDKIDSFEINILKSNCLLECATKALKDFKTLKLMENILK